VARAPGQAPLARPGSCLTTSHLSLTRAAHVASSHNSPTQLCGQDPRASRTAHGASTPRAGTCFRALPRTVRLRPSRCPCPAEHTHRPPPAPLNRPARSQSARATA
jgi:hypothetical protein